MTLTSKEYFLKNVKICDKIDYVDSKNDYFNYICYITKIEESDRSVNINTSSITFFVDFENKQIHGIDKETNLSYEVTHIRSLNVSSFFLDANNLSDNNEIKDKKEITMSDLCSTVRTGQTIEYIHTFSGSFYTDKVRDLEGDHNSYTIIGDHTKFKIDFILNKIYSNQSNNSKLLKVGDLDLSKLFENNPQLNDDKFSTENFMNENPEIKTILDKVDNFKGIAIDPQETEVIDKPSRYNGDHCQQIIEQWPIKKANGNSAGFSWCIGNILKYLYRIEEKGDPIQQIDKAIWYLNRIKTYYQNEGKKVK